MKGRHVSLTQWHWAVFGTCLFLAFCLAWSAPAQEVGQSKEPALIRADEILYDEALGVVTASGNVEISQEDRVATADTVSYNLRTEVVTASGNVSIVEPNGDVFFADYVELTQDLREGFIRDIRVLMTDGTRIAAAGGQRSGGKRTVFRRAVFSPCDLCKEDPTRPPLWQIKASRVIHDQEEKVVQYNNARMELFGVPVAYTPYFEHPDPTVKRKTGLLAPSFGSSETLGFTVQTPFYWDIAPNKDATFEPIFTTKRLPVLAGEYRQLFPNGRLEFRGSGTIADRLRTDGTTKRDALRGHIDAFARYEIDDTWRAGLDAKRTTDDTYLRLYDFSSKRTLTSRAYVEGFRGRNYAAVNGYVYQGLRANDDNDQSPIIFPTFDYNFIGEPDAWGGRFSLDADATILTRVKGRDSRRISLNGGWQIPFSGLLGDLYTFSAGVQADGYWVHGVDPDSDDPNPTGDTTSTVTGRVLPQVALTWRYPWVRHGETIQQVIEPIAQIVVSPNGRNPGEIPNEDSLDFEFDDTNLLSLNRFTGSDRVDSGQRIDYGLKWSGFSETLGRAGFFVGQSYKLRDDDTFKRDSGLDEHFSDIVGRVRINPIRYADLLYRFRLDKEDFTPRRNEVDLNLGPPVLNLNLSYTFIDGAGSTTSEFGDREEIFLRLNSQINENWSAFISHRRDLTADDDLVSRIGVTYQDECFLISLVGERSFFNDREIESEDAIFVQVSFKHLGEIGNL